MNEHPLFRMWKDRLDAELAQEQARAARRAARESERADWKVAWLAYKSHLGEARECSSLPRWWNLLGWQRRRCFGQVLVRVSFAYACVAIAGTLQAQERSGAVQLRAGAALGVATTSVGGEKSTKVGPLLTGQFGVALSSRTDLTLELAVQPFKAQNPVRDEAFTGVYTLAGVQVGFGESRRVYLRPELGLVFRSWSGSSVFVPSETGLAVGLGIGREWPLGAKLGLAAEGFVRLSGADELSTTLVGLGLSLVPVGARPRAR